MFRITDQHFGAFREQLVDNYALTLAARIQERFPDELRKLGMDPQQALPFVKRSMDKAKHYQVVRTLDVELFVDCCILLTPDFDKSPEFPWAGETLCRDDLDGTAKMDLIHDYLVFATNKAR
jgi:hypothetical protein